MEHDAKYFIEKFQMQLHPEGGWFKETYRSNETILKDHLPNRFSDGRSFSTAIYFLLEGDQFSSFHRIKSDELWHFYYGDALNIYVLDKKKNREVIKLGSNLEGGETFQAVVKAGSWFASQPAEKKSFSLVGCTVAPGFDFSDFELAKSRELIKRFPQEETLIKKYCRHS